MSQRGFYGTPPYARTHASLRETNHIADCGPDLQPSKGVVDLIYRFDKNSVIK